VAEIVKECSSSEYAIDDKLSRFTWMPHARTAVYSWTLSADGASVRLTGAVSLNKEIQNEPNRLSHVDVRLHGSLPATSLPTTKYEQH
jgi:hypothetical protein